MSSSKRSDKKVNQIVNWIISFFFKAKIVFVFLLRLWQFFEANVCGVAVFGYEIKETQKTARKNNANCSLNATRKAAGTKPQEFTS